jgi:AcrR family transcriptional regulator
MHISKPDPRSEATKKSIIKAYLKLLSQKNRNTISVKDILLAANVHKSTLYRHFSNITEIELAIEEIVLDRISSILKKTDFKEFLSGRQEFLHKIGAAFNEELYEYRSILLTNNTLHFAERLDNELSDIIKSVISENTNIPDLEASVLYTFLFWGRIAVFRKWILDGCTEPIQDISNVLNRISSAGFESVYELFDQ